MNVTSRQMRPAAQAGFALIVALLALVLLTFLGLTLAVTTSTELQISTNYRWNQQALYNAEAGLEISRALLARIGDGQLVLPETRPGVWDPAALPFTPVMPIARFTAGITRNFEGSGCDRWGNGAGYGQVLVDPNNPGVPFENISQPVGAAAGDPRLNGAFTVWVRRDLQFGINTAFDNPVGESIIVTSEGTAPYSGPETAFTRANRAIRRLESRVILREGCRPSGPQTSTTGFSDCEFI